MLYNNIVSRTPVTKGWSGDLKYCVTDSENNRYLLRISAPELFSKREAAFQRMTQVATLGIPMCMPLEFGSCEEGVYSIQSWIDGVDAEPAIMALSSTQQYAYGINAGQILQKLHSIPAPEHAIPWQTRYGKKIDRKIEMYQNCSIHYDEDKPFFDYIRQTRHLLANCRQTYQHGDYHIGNMMLDHNGVLTIIDFDRDDYGDPWEEFNRVVWCAQAAPWFATGMIDGYFDHNIPEDFWKLLALYICTNTLSSLPWALPFGDQEIQTMKNQARDVLQWYDHMRCPVPKWYQKTGSQKCNP